jgi:hypothetical protein
MAGIVLSIEVDDKGTVKVKKFSDETKKAFDEMKKGPEQAKGSLSSLSDSWIGLTAKVTLATGAIYGVTRALGSFINEAAQAEEIENRLRFALETTGYNWEYAKSAVDQFANSIQESTRFSDEQARQALTDMMMYTNDFTKAQMGSKLAMDMSVRTGMDLVTSARYIGMAMSGNAEMLGRYIPQLRNLDNVLGSNASMADKAAYAMKILQEKFGGTAQADLNSYTGIVAQFKNQWSDLKEEIGYGLLPVLKDTFEWLTKILKSMKEQRELMKEAGSTGFWSFESLGKPIPGMPYHAPEMTTPAWIKEWVAGWKPAAQIKPDILPESKKIKDDIEKTVLEYHKLLAEVDKLSEAGKMPSWEDSLWSYPGRTLPDINALNLEFNKLIANAENLSAAGTMPDWRESLEDIPKGFVEIENHLYTLRDIIDSYDTEAAQWTKDWVANWKTSSERIKDVWVSFSENISNAWSTNMMNIIKSTESTSQKIKSFFQGIGDVFLSTVSKMITQWLLFGSIYGQKEKPGGFLGGGSWGGILGNIASLFTSAQEGGIFTKPTPVLMGDAGDEAAIPLKGGKIPIEGKTGGDTYIINNYNQINDPNTFVRLYGPVVKKLSEQSAAEAKRLHHK